MIKNVFLFALKPESHLRNIDCVILYFTLIAIPRIIIFSIAQLYLIDEEMQTPDIKFALKAILLAPFIETMLFFGPIIFFPLKEGTFRWIKIIGFGSVFALSHSIFDDRPIWSVIFQLWSGLVMAFVYDDCLRRDKSSVWIVTAIHTATNTMGFLFLCIAYFVTQKIATTEFRFIIFMAIMLALIFVLSFRASQIEKKYRA